jgi:hypothetical protein
VLAGAVAPDVLVTTPLCAACPHSPAGCCAAPPRIALADLGRIVHHGGKDFLVAELAAGRLVHGPGDAWLNYPRRLHASGVLACGYLGSAGCVLPPTRRSTTCNAYVCDEALDRAPSEDEPERVRANRDALEACLADWDAELAARWPDGGALDGPRLDALGVAYAALARAR